MIKIFDDWIKSWQHICDCSNNFLESTIPRGTGPPRMRNIFKAISYWMRLHISDSNNSLESTIPRGTVPQQKRTMMPYSEDNSELATISKRADSWLTSFLKRTPLKLIFIVRVTKHVGLLFVLLTSQ